MDAGHRPRIPRRTFAAAAALVALAGASACSGEEEHSVVLVSASPTTTVLPGEDLAATALSLSAALFEAADIAVVATEDTVGPLAALSAASGVPLLVGTDRAVAEELSRLGARAVLTASGGDAAAVEALGEDLEVLEVDPVTADEEAPQVSADGAPLPVTLFVDPELDLPSQALAAAVVAGVGGTVAEIPGGALGRSGDSVAAVTSAVGDDPAVGVLALGASFGPSEDFSSALARTAGAPQLPGGGTTVFPGRRMIAAYGSPGVPSLGILGEQGLEESIARVQALAAEYDGLTDEQIIPAFEIITTIASEEAGADGDHSRELPVDLVREWVDAAGEAGVYVVLDLQPGTTDFLTQAKLYEELLLAPHVGLALDPEWRLEPGQKHLEQIGAVSAEEVNQVSGWLADLTAEHSLPQKVLILHQFSHSMITERQDIDASRPELAITLHADGHGAPGDKLGTYATLQQDLPEGIAMAWKNFYDEDSPMFTPEQTYEVEPRPWFVSYQ